MTIKQVLGKFADIHQRMKKTAFFLLALVFSLASCLSDKGEAFTPGCNSMIYYSSDIRPILDAKCGNCHSSNITYMSGPDFTDFNVLKERIKNGSFRDRVFTRKDMPTAGFDQLTESELGKLKCWLDQGARNN